MTKMLKTIVGGLLLTGLFVGGCTTDMQVLTSERKTRIEGARLYNRGDYENATGTFRNAIKQDPRDFRSQYYLGLSYERQGNYQQAVQCYKASMQIMRESLAGRDAIEFRQVVMNSLAAALCKHDDNALEQNLLQKQAKDVKVDDKLRAESYFLLAKVQRYRRDADSALTSYFKASEIDAGDFYLQKEAGLYMLQLGQKRQAEAPLQRASKINSRDAEVNAALQQLNLPLPLAAIRNENGIKPLHNPVPLPAGVDTHMGDTPVAVPEELPLD